jgi:hypothetical protein
MHLSTLCCLLPTGISQDRPLRADSIASFRGDLLSKIGIMLVITHGEMFFVPVSDRHLRAGTSLVSAFLSRLVADLRFAGLRVSSGPDQSAAIYRRIHCS